jgi:hypothetical protein
LLLEYLFFAHDGWGREEFLIKDGEVIIRAWTSHIVISEKVLLDVNSHARINNGYAIEIPKNSDMDRNLNIVQVTSNLIEYPF